MPDRFIASAPAQGDDGASFRCFGIENESRSKHEFFSRFCCVERGPLRGRAADLAAMVPRPVAPDPEFVKQKGPSSGVHSIALVRAGTAFFNLEPNRAYGRLEKGCISRTSTLSELFLGSSGSSPSPAHAKMDACETQPHRRSSERHRSGRERCPKRGGAEFWRWNVCQYCRRVEPLHRWRNTIGFDWGRCSDGQDRR